MPTAPSVPVRGQSYGYEESGTGELILQKPPTEGHTGLGADTVGRACRAAGPLTVPPPHI